MTQNLHKAPEGTRIRALQDATGDARERTGVNIGTQIKGGMIQVVRVDKVLVGKRYRTEVTELSPYMPYSDVVGFIEKLEC